MTIIWYIGWCRFFCGLLRILTAHGRVQPNFFLYVNGRNVNNHIFFGGGNPLHPEWILIYFLLKEWTATKRGDDDDEIQNLSYKSDGNISSKKGGCLNLYTFSKICTFFLCLILWVDSLPQWPFIFGRMFKDQISKGLGGGFIIVGWLYFGRRFILGGYKVSDQNLVRCSDKDCGVAK